eukprot:COSAG05_NODE_1636_length_4365_cov_8.688467_5_plen_500_part_00
MRFPAICDGVTQGFAPGTGSSLLLCAPFKQDQVTWAGSRLSVLDVDTKLETDWSPLLPLVLGVGFIPYSSVGWAPPLSTDDTSTSASAAPARSIHAVVGSELILIDIDQFQNAVADGAVTPSQLLELLMNSPQQVAKLVKRLPHCVNIRDTKTGDTVLHLCACDGNVDGLRCLLSDTGASYTPVLNASGITALELAIQRQYQDCARELWQQLTPSLNETTALHVSSTLALLASKRTTSMLVLPFLRDSEHSITRELTSFRTTFQKPIAIVTNSSTLSETDLDNTSDTDQAISLWRTSSLLPDHKLDDVTPVASRVVLLPGLCDDPYQVDPRKRAFHLIVENCDASVFDNDLIKLAVDFKWTHNVRKIVLMHLAGYSLSLLMATAGMVASTQSSKTITCPACWMPSARVDALLIAVIVCETIALGSETMQLQKQKEQYFYDGGGWNILDVLTSAFLMAAAIAHFSGDLESVRTLGSIGVTCKWFGCEKQVACCAAVCVSC